jgi:hypothetical protein
MARPRGVPEREEVVEYTGGISVGHRRVPVWLMLVTVGVIAWGLFYLIKYSVTDTGTFGTPGAGAMFLRF